ncbi:DUF6817 domain-containing protein [Streptomyces misionensis]|uniref:DUF6817 domain-containing protein n=1 Tax=Streptomyces misionensis TaxID=67331 RepID=UPI0036A9E45D
MSASLAASAQATALLRRLGATRVAHPGGTLLVHLQRVRELLATWGARPALQLAGLCHASYGTDGFPAALLSPDRRGELAEVIGAEAEAIVHLYASCDRAATYPALPAPDAPFHDRFTGRTHVPDPQLVRDFAELTAANELDIARVDPAFRDAWAPELLPLFTRLRPLLTDRAWSTCQEVLAPRGQGRGD